MRPDFDRLVAFEREHARRTPASLECGLRIVEALRQEAVALGVWSRLEPLAGIEADIRVAKAFNVRAASGADR